MDAPRVARIAGAGRAALVAILSLLVLAPPSAPREPNLELSHGIALAHFLKTGARAGHDYWFTYGPLGSLSMPIYFEGLFAWKLLWELGVALLAAFVLVRLLGRLPGFWTRAAFALTLAYALPRTPTLYPVLVVGAGLDLLHRERWSRWDVARSALAWALLGLAKFSYLLLGATALACAMLGAPRPHPLRRALALLAACAGVFGTAWLGLGQSPADLGAWLRSSLELSAGYSEAMALPGRPEELARALGACGLLLAALLTLPSSLWRSRRGVAAVALLGASTFLSFKGGFVRHDPIHATTFYGFAALAAFFAATLRTLAPATRAQALAAALALALPLHALSESRAEPLLSPRWVPRRLEILAENLGLLLGPRATLERLRTGDREARRSLALPRIRARVGHESIDVVSLDQMTLVLNDLVYRPRPVLQGYAAYTPELARANGAFFRGPAAPRFVMTRLATIDDRFLPHDDPVTLLELVRRYRPLFAEGAFLLLERRPPPEARRRARANVIRSGALRFGEALRLPARERMDVLHTLSVDLSYSLPGRLRRFLLRSEPVTLEIRESQGWRSHRILPTLASVEFLIDPIVEGNGDLIALYAHAGQRRAHEIRIRTTSAGEWQLQPEIRFTLRRHFLPPPALLPLRTSPSRGAGRSRGSRRCGAAGGGPRRRPQWPRPRACRPPPGSLSAPGSGGSAGRHRSCHR